MCINSLLNLRQHIWAIVVTVIQTDSLSPQDNYNTHWQSVSYCSTPTHPHIFSPCVLNTIFLLTRMHVHMHVATVQQQTLTLCTRGCSRGHVVPTEGPSVSSHSRHSKLSPRLLLPRRGRLVRGGGRHRVTGTDELPRRVRPCTNDVCGGGSFRDNC